MTGGVLDVAEYQITTLKCARMHVFFFHIVGVSIANTEPAEKVH